MNEKKAKQIRKIAKAMVSSQEPLKVQFYVEKTEEGQVKDTLIPMPAEWAKGTYRQVYKELKRD